MSIVVVCHHASCLPGGSDGKESACNTGDLGLTPGSGRPPGERNGNPLQYSCWGIPMDRGALWATEEPGGLQPLELRRIRQDWVTNTHAMPNYWLHSPHCVFHTFGLFCNKTCRSQSPFVVLSLPIFLLSFTLATACLFSLSVTPFLIC